jgi:L-lactate dehydrogenase complex protein LldG
VYCADEQELIAQLNALMIAKGWNKIYSKETDWLSSLRPLQFDPVTTEDLAECDAAITLCSHLVARTGTIVLSSKDASGRTASVYAPIHICIAYADQLVYDIADSLVQFKNNPEGFPSMISFATGPSRTADIEKTLVVGVHGPKEVYCFLIDNTPV